MAVTEGDPAQRDEVPCPFCGYDLRAHVAQDATHDQPISRCPECGERVSHEQIIDTVRLLCEDRSPLLAFFLLPIDLMRLLFPRRHLARYGGLGARPRLARRVLLIGLPLWLMSAALLFVFAAILADVTFVPSCMGGERTDPYTTQALAAVGTRVSTNTDVAVAIGVFVSAFAVALLVFAFALARLRPEGPRGQVQFMAVHGVRRTMYLTSPLFCGLVVLAGMTLLYLKCQAGDEFACEGTPNVLLAFLAAPLLFQRLSRMGYVDGKERGALVYMGCGLLALLAWFAWIIVLAGLFLEENLGQTLRLINLW